MRDNESWSAFAESDYQIAGSLGYKTSHRWVLVVGYRYLCVNYWPNGVAKFVFDGGTPGVVMGATFNTK